MPTGRFAPSPSGPLHLGNLRTAMVAWLCARSDHSRFIVRIEDLDPITSRREHEVTQLADLAALGLDWDGAVVRQSQRAGEHQAVLHDLARRDLTYPCFCSRREVREATVAPHGMPGTYPGTCRALSADEAAHRVHAGIPAAWRLRSEGQAITIVDRWRGAVTQGADDIVLRRNDGVAAYHLAVVVDDDDQGVAEVVRGDDLLAATSSQAFLLDLLARPRPQWAHVPLVRGPDGERLAKRHGAVTLPDLAADGVDADRVRSRLAASLGLAGPNEIVTMAQLLGRFDPEQRPPDQTPLPFGPHGHR